MCRDTPRGPRLLCVVEESRHAAAVERAGAFTGPFHVLGGAISPIDGIGPSQLRVGELVSLLADGDLAEVIVATGWHVEGEATARYLARVLAPPGAPPGTRPGPRLCRVAPPWPDPPRTGDLADVDPAALRRAFRDRRDL